MFGLGLQELIIIMVIALVIFGGKSCPKSAAGSERRYASLNAGPRSRTRSM